MDRACIRAGIQDSVAKSLDVSGLFNRVNPPGSPIDYEDIKKYASEIPSDIFRQGFLSNPEDFLREIAKQATASASERQGALDVAGYNLFGIAEKFTLFSPKTTDSPYQEVIQGINNDYQEEVVKLLQSNIYTIAPSEALISAYEKEYTKEEVEYSTAKTGAIKPKLPDINSQTWKDLVGKIGVAQTYDSYVRNGYVIPSASSFPETFQGVNATMKIIAALEKTPRTTYPSKQIEGFYNDLRKHGTPEVQISLLKQYIADHNIKEINKVDLIRDLLTEISYVVEIEIAKVKFGSAMIDDYSRKDYNNFTLNNDNYTYNFIQFDSEDLNGVDEYRKNDDIITKSEYDDAHLLYKMSIHEDKNTTVYSNLTVPGGTNYTENNINTPAIEPSIKGHAQFQTPNSIGWFRSDEQVTGGKKSLQEDEYIQGNIEGLSASQLADIERLRGSTSPTKTRRILEIQSDLFQKGRNREHLTGKIENDYEDRNIFYREFEYDINQFRVSTPEGLYFRTGSRYTFRKNGTIGTDPDFQRPITKEEYYSQIKIANEYGTDDQFLQLLNKDNNWVTFFVKSIIQDTARKGYEKAWFPQGDTAAKIEGHETLTDYIVGRERMLEDAKKNSNREYVEAGFNAQVAAQESHIKQLSQKTISPEKITDKKQDFYISPKVTGTKKNYSRVRKNMDSSYSYPLDLVNDKDYKGWVLQNYTVGEDSTNTIVKISDEQAQEYLDKDFEIRKKIFEEDLGTAEVRLDNFIESKELWIEDRLRNAQAQIAQFEKEIKEARDGTLKIGAIHNFYEATIFNILKKQGYNPTKVVDEYNNGWYEVNIKDTDYADQRILYGLKDVVEADLSVDYNTILEEAGLTETSVPQDFIEAEMQEYSKVIANFRKANPTFEIEWTDETSGYTGSTSKDLTGFRVGQNKILINLREMDAVAKKENMPLKQVISIYTIHEMAHAASYYAIETGKNEQVVSKFFEAAKKHHKNIVPFEDVMRQGFLLEDGTPYFFKDIHEFVAEAFSNPYFQEYLKSIPYEGDKSLWQSIIDAILDFFGIQRNKPSLYDEVIDFINSERIQKDNREGSEHPSTEWNMELIYHGSPKTYTQAAFELFTSPNVQGQIEEIIKKLPREIIAIKKQLEYETNKDKIRKLQSLLDAFNDVKENDNVIKVSINMLLQASDIAKTMHKELLEIPKLKDDSKKLILAYSLLRNIESLEGIKPLAEAVVRIVEREGVTANIKPFVTSLKEITSVTSSVRETYLEVAQPLIIKQLTEITEEGEAEKSIRKEIVKLRAQLKTETSGGVIALINEKIKRYEDQLRLVPNKTNLDLIFAGNYRDSSSSQHLFQAAMANGHPIPSTVMKMLRQNNINVSQQMLKIVNEHQTEWDELKKVLGVDQIRDVGKFTAPIRTLVSRADSVAEDENGNPIMENGKPKFTYTTQKMLLSEYDPDYIKQATEKKALIDYYFKKFGQADRANDTEGITKYRQLLNQAYKERRDFFRQNSEGKYLEPVLQMYDLLEKEVRKPDGTITTFGRERGYIFEDIEQAERRRGEETVLETLDLLQDEIKQLHIELGQLKSKFDPETGQEKTGFEKELSDIANQYSELKRQYGTYELTEQGQAMFDKAKLTLEQSLNSGDISQEEFDRRMAEISVTELTDEYYEQVKYYLERIDGISQQLADIPEFKAVFKGVNSERIREGYAKIRDLVKGFRDNEMTIDGQLFSRVRPELVKEIQAIQQDVENLKGIAEKLKGLTIEESIRAKELRGKKVRAEITDEELDELNTLQAKLKDSQRLYLEYKELIDEYSTLLEEFSELNDSSPSQYYQDELENQKAVFIAQKTEEIMKQIKGATSLEDGKYIKVGNEWTEVKRTEGTRQVVETVEKKGFKTIEEAIANKIARKTASREVRKTDWWKNNHYDKYVWTGKGYEKKSSPIYIWVKTQPVDESYIKESQPSIKFKTYRIFDGREVNGVKEPDYTNPNHGLMNDSIPLPKQGSFRNAEYDKLKNATDAKSKAYFRYLEFVRKSLRRAQEFLPPERRLGDILPSFVKTEDELAVEFTNNVADRSKKVAQGQWALAMKASQDYDEQTLTGGSTTNFYAQNRILPIRFSGRMDANEQSSDIAAMVLAYEHAAIEYNQQSEDQALLEGIRIVVENLPVEETKKLAGKFSLANILSAAKAKFITREKETHKSNLSTTIDHILDTYLYGETRREATVTLGGVDYDLNKASRALKRISSLSIFSLNAFVAVKNTVSAYIQGNINSNIGQGFFTKSQYNKAHAEAVRHVKEFWFDYRKFGNKSKIGQELDFFQVMQGASYNEYGQKTAWTVLKNKANFLTSLKNASEYELQVAQYLAMSKANPVQLADGSWVEMRKAFELKDGTLTPVAGAKITQKQIDSFIFKLGYVNRIINGAYRAEEKNAIQKNILGDLVFYLNGYVVPLMVNRFGKTNHSAEADMVTKGYIRETMGFLGDLVKFRAGLTKQWSLLSTDERHRVLRGTKEILAILGMAALVLAMSSGGDDKKELLQKSAIQNWALSIALAVKAETETFVPIPGMGLNDMARKMNSPFAAVRQVSLMIKTLQNFIALGVDQMGIANIDSAYYKTTSLHDGFHDKGDAKAIANFLKLVGWSGIGFDSVEKVLQQKNIQTLR